MSPSSYAFIGKVFLISACISLGIKTLGPPLALPATPLFVWSLVLLPTVLLGMTLGLHHRTQRR